jgi:4,5-DOPA dioxygenase extradiol
MSKQMPTLFIGHGSPMNAIEENEFTEGWREIVKSVPRPEAIVCVSAHWFTPSTQVMHAETPRTIHDFYGFPPELYKEQYPAPGAPKLAEKIASFLMEYSVGLDTIWGLDHGTWSVLKRMYPEADIPTIQLSIDYSKPPKYQYEIGQKLEFLRDQGVLIIGSGNLVHNLGAVVWNQPRSVYNWAQHFEDEITLSLFTKDESVFLDFGSIEELSQKSHPSLDHYLPLLYAVGAGGLELEPVIYNQKIIYGSISMTCFKFG